MDHIDVATVEKKIRELLEKKVEERPEEKPTDEQLSIFDEICDELSRRMFGISQGDGDTTVTVRLTDRTRGRMPYFVAVPYGMKAETMAEEVRIWRACQNNLKVATDEFDSVVRMFDDHVLRPLLNNPIQFNAEQAAKLICARCYSGYSQPQRKDDGSWWHHEGDLKPLRCPGAALLESQYQHEQESKGEEDE